MDILCCPTCKSSLQLHVKKDRDDKVIEGSLQCVNCKKMYPITDGIPNFIDEISDE